MKRRANAENYKALHTQLLEDTAKLIGHPPDALVTRFVALARLKMQAIEVQLIAGNHHAATAAEIDVLRQQLEPYMPKAQSNVRVTFVGGKDIASDNDAAVDGLIECRRCHWKPFNRDRVTRCYRCGWAHGADTNASWTPVIEPAATYATINDRGHVTPAPAGNVAPLKQQPQQHPDDELEDKRRARIADLRILERGGAPVQAPRVNYNSDGGSCSDLMRRIENAYR
jgi:hypothetical protein